MALDGRGVTPPRTSSAERRGGTSPGAGRRGASPGAGARGVHIREVPIGTAAGIQPGLDARYADAGKPPKAARPTRGARRAKAKKTLKLADASRKAGPAAGLGNGPAVKALEDVGQHGPAAVAAATPGLKVKKRPLFQPAHGREGTPVPIRKKPSFDRGDGTVSVTEVPPLKWDVTDPSSAGDRRAERSVSKSPSGGRSEKGRGKGKKGKGKGGKGKGAKKGGKRGRR